MRLPKFRLYDYNTPGKGVSKYAPPKKGFALFFDIFSRRFWKMVSLNAIYCVFSIPSIIVHILIIWFGMTLFAHEGLVQNPDTAPVFVILLLLLSSVSYTLIGGGAPTSGMTHVIKNYRIDTHSWMWSDFWSTYKKTFFKSTAVFLIDMLMLSLICINFWYYGMSASESIVAYLLQGLMVVVLLIFLLMHSYVYPILVSTDKSIKDVYKSSLLLALGKLPITFCSTFVCLALCVAISFLSLITIYAALLIPIIMFTLSTYINLFITYPVVQKYLLKNSDA